MEITLSEFFFFFSLLSMVFNFLHTLRSALCVRKFAPIQLHCPHLVMCSVILVSTNISLNMDAAQSHTFLVLQNNSSGSMLMIQTRKEQYSDNEWSTRIERTRKVKDCTEFFS